MAQIQAYLYSQVSHYKMFIIYNNQIKPWTSFWFGASINKGLILQYLSVHLWLHACLGLVGASYISRLESLLFSSVFLDRTYTFPRKANTPGASSVLHCNVTRTKHFFCLTAALFILPFELKTEGPLTLLPHQHYSPGSCFGRHSYLLACQIKHLKQDIIQIRSVINVFP